MNNPNQFGINQQGYGMPIQPQNMMSQQMNNMYMNNNPQMGMNIGYPQQQYNNYPQGNAYTNPNMGYNMQQPNLNYNNSNAPQQNKTANNQRGSALDFF